MKKFSSFLSIVLTLAVVFGNFSLPVFAYDKGITNVEQTKTKTLSDISGTILNKLNSVSKSNNSLSQDLPIIQKGGATLEKSQQTEVKKDYVEGEILVKYKNNKINLNTTSGRTTALNFIHTKSLEKKEDLIKNNISVLKIKDTKTVEQKIAELKNDPNVEYAQPNYQYYPTDFANDTYADSLWGLNNYGQNVNGVTGTSGADADVASALIYVNEGTNSTAIVAVIDSGVAYNHSDLAANMWNGANCVSDTNTALGGCNHGYDYQDNDKTPLPTISSHGTHIAGTIAAVKDNNMGILGVAPNAKIMALKSSLTTADNIKAINFAKYNGAKVINASWGDCFIDGAYSHIFLDQALYNAIRDFPGLFVAAAGNDGQNHDSGNLDTMMYPAGFKVTSSAGPGLDNIIVVAATDQNDNLANGGYWASDYGTTSVDVGAPGVNVLSTVADSVITNETFEGVTPPAIPSGWVKGNSFLPGCTSLEGYSATTGQSCSSVATNNWGTYPFSFGNVLYGDLTTPYANNANTTVTSPTYNLGGNSGATFSFDTRCATEYTTTDWRDYMQLEYSADGTNFTPAIDPPLFGGNNSFRWDQAELDFLNGTPQSSFSYYTFTNVPIPSQYLTGNFKFRFRWVTNATDNSYDGCRVNNIKIIKLSNGSDNLYAYDSGTSMAAPHVAGLVALIEGYNPNLTSEQVKNIILTTGDSLNSLNGKTTTGKRINAYNALLAANPAKAITAFTIPNQVGTTVIDETAHTITVTVPFGTNVTALIPTITITGASISPITGVANNFTTPQTYTVTAADGSTKYYIVTVVSVPESSLKISTNSANPMASNIMVSNNNSTVDVLMNKFNIKATGSNVIVTKINLVLTGTGATPAEIASQIKIKVNGTLISVDDAVLGVNGTYEFTLDNALAIPMDTTTVFSVYADINHLGGNFTQGDSLKIDYSSVVADDPNGDNVTNITGSANGETQTFYSEGIFVNLVSVAATKTVGESGSTSDSGTFNISFDVTAFGGDMWIDKTAPTVNGGTIESDLDITGTGTVQAIITTSGATSGVNGYLVPEGTTKRFTITTIISPTASGFFNVKLADILYALSDVNGNLHYIPNNFVTSSIYLNAVPTTSTISGTIKYYDGIKVVPNVTVILENGVGAQIATTTTDANGAYQFTGVTNGSNYVVRASKSDTSTTGLSGADQGKIGRAIVGLEPFSTIYKNVAGDVNNSGGLSGADQGKIGRFIVGLDASLLSGAWKFYSSSATLTTQNYLNTGLIRTYTNLTVDSPNQDFVGIKMGDVNNSWVSI